MFKVITLSIILVFTLIGCKGETLPKPKGELRLEYPKAHYQPFNNTCSYTFEFSDFAKVTPAKQRECWFNLSYPKMKANVFLTYFPIRNDFQLHVKEAEKMVYEHTIKASAIETKSFSYPEKRVFGNFYELKGESASNIQFFITDSTHHFITGNLYFNSRPKPDSLAPAVEYIKTDILHLIETFQWKK
ncbi:gliding motility lipoprotein GldD [Riemerella anatipestifer]|uniref:gliding motility lipoprotein GldD n=1 Tax=Riemerella anatipestifer TaxID=34085 RepID=UPI0012ADC5EF|nr:gliding motility lipoprotein GldD [Riemerella anatipestifer]USL94926.1 gliding motility lipoprotein GldD [Riemerella anatipestifer]